MGVQGLKTFVDENSLRVARQLSATKLVIDGNNLQRTLYATSSWPTRDFVFGGDYHAYRRTIVQFFDALKRCAVTGIVCLDGNNNPAIKKLKKNKFAKRLAMIRKLVESNGQSGDARDGQDLFALLANNVFISTLIELQIETIQTLYDADGLIAFTANKHGCPVLSDDSDFYIYNLPNGVIAFENFHWQSVSTDPDSGDHRIPVQIYHYENLLRLYPGLQQHHLPLFAVIIGNDYTDRQTFHSLIGQIKREERFPARLRTEYGKGRRALMNCLLQWLCSRDRQQVLADIEKHASKSKQQMNDINTAIRDYEIVDDSENRGRETEAGNIAEWLISDYLRNPRIRPKLLKIIGKRVFSLTPQMCNVTTARESPAACSAKLQEYLFGLLSTGDDEEPPFQVKDHDRMTIVRRAVKPLRRLDSGEHLPDYKDLRGVGLVERKQLIKKMLVGGEDDDDVEERDKSLLTDCELSDEEVDRLFYLLLTLRFWRSNSSATDAEKRAFVRALIVCVLRYSLNEAVDDHLMMMTDDESAYLAATAETAFRPDVSRLFSQYLWCVYCLQLINSLLGFPLADGNVSVCLNGVLVYKLTLKLMAGETDGQSCAQRLIASKPLQTLCDVLVKRLDGVVDDDEE